jgi:hypothetical protein
VTGNGCLAAESFGDPCIPATGQVNYGSGVNCPASSSYTLTVPDWVTGPSDIQAIGVNDWVNSNGKKAKSPQIYAFAVPVDGSCPVTSVTLPDVSNTVLASPGPAGLVLPALHVFGVALRNTTTSTPLISGSSQASPSNQAWTGAFESPVEDAFGLPSGYTWGNQTMRIAASVNGRGRGRSRAHRDAPSNTRSRVPVLRPARLLPMPHGRPVLVHAVRVRPVHLRRVPSWRAGPVQWPAPQTATVSVSPASRADAAFSEKELARPTPARCGQARCRSGSGPRALRAFRGHG